MNSPERLFDLAIVGKSPIAFVRVRFAPQIMQTLAQIAYDYQDEIRKLRFISSEPSFSLELWLRSRYGTWRFFRVNGNDIVEIDREGKIQSVKPA